MIDAPRNIALKSSLALATAGLLVACSSQPTLPRGMQTHSEAKEARVTVSPVGESAVSGQLQVDIFGDGIRISGTLHGFPRQGEFAFHIREHGDCGNDARNAGAIFNPLGSRHGRYARGEHMLGDMDNLDVDATLSTAINRGVQGLTLGGGDYTDIANRSFVIHESPDDYATQPAGNSGRAIACGVVQVTNPPPKAG